MAYDRWQWVRVGVGLVAYAGGRISSRSCRAGCGRCPRASTGTAARARGTRWTRSRPTRWAECGAGCTAAAASWGRRRWARSAAPAAGWSWGRARRRARRRSCTRTCAGRGPACARCPPGCIRRAAASTRCCAPCRVRVYERVSWHTEQREQWTLAYSMAVTCSHSAVITANMRNVSRSCSPIPSTCAHVRATAVRAIEWNALDCGLERAPYCEHIVHLLLGDLCDRRHALERQSTHLPAQVRAAMQCS